MAKTLILKIFSSADSKAADSILAKDVKTQVITLGGTQYTMSLQDLNFHKKMYQPGEIVADIQLNVVTGDWKAAVKTSLETAFKAKKVELTYGDLTKEVSDTGVVTTKISNEVTICKDYYVHQVEPRYKSSSLFVTLRIFSPDKVLTLDAYCHSFVSKRLCRDIINGQKGNFPLPFDLSKSIAFDYDNMQVLANSGSAKEAIFPYLVQYNESFYDFLVRTTNRWGEFLYYEGDKLHIGYNSTSKKIESFNMATYCDLTDTKVDQKSNSQGNYADAVTYDAHMLNSPLKKSEYDAVKGVLGCDKENGGDVWGMKIAGNLLTSGKSIYDFLVDTTVDETIAMLTARKKTKDKNDKFDETYFSTDSLDDVKRTHYNEALNEYNPYAESTPHLTADRYKKVLKGEINAGQNAVCVDFDTNYQDLGLGQVFTIDDKCNGATSQYIVVEAGTKKRENLLVVDGKVVPSYTTTYQIIGIKQDATDKKFYPTVHPAGHVRNSGTQLAQVTTVDDPTRQERVRVKFPWQGAGDDDSPYLVYARPGGNAKVGTYHKRYEGEEVIVEFANGNVERPYVAGALSSFVGQIVPPALYTNNLVQVTPGGQSIKMTDGTGAGATALIAALAPAYKTIQGFYPGKTMFESKSNKSFEGSIELADKFGFYSIKGSTDGRNVSIKSAWGDIKLNAFTGITISAPNGDVKIQGKNVSIEAGNNLTLTSGKNIKDKFYITDHGLNVLGNIAVSAANAITKKLATLVGGFIDVSILRSVVEVFIRPVEGKLLVKSNRYLALEAGKGAVAYPTDNYEKPINSGFVKVLKGKKKAKKFQSQQELSDSLAYTFGYIPQLVNRFYGKYETVFNSCTNLVTDLKDTISKFQNGNELPCKPYNEIIDGLWNGSGDINIDTIIGFKGVYGPKTKKDADIDFVKFFVPGYTGRGSQVHKESSILSALMMQANRKKKIKEKVSALKEKIFELKSLTFKHFVEETNEAVFDTEVKDALKDIPLPALLNDHYNPYKIGEGQYFDGLMSAQYVSSNKLKLRRKCYITLVELLQFPREKVGAVNGVGAHVPPVPNPYADNIDWDWARYVDSIQDIFAKAGFLETLGDKLKDTLIDSTLGSVGGLVDDLKDWYAYGSGKNGKILFSDGCTTRVLGTEITKAKVRQMDDPDDLKGLSKAAAEYIRTLMKEP